MTSITVQISIVAALLLGGCGMVDAPEQPEPTANQKDLSWWELVDSLGSRMPLALSDLEQSFMLKVNEKYSTQYRTDWIGSGFPLRDNLVVSSTNLSLATAETPHRFIRFTINFEGQCVTPEQVRTRYPTLALTGVSSPHAADHVDVWSTTEPWGKLKFAFREASETYCLDRVTLSPSGS